METNEVRGFSPDTEDLPHSGKASSVTTHWPLKKFDTNKHGHQEKKGYALSAHTDTEEHLLARDLFFSSFLSAAFDGLIRVSIVVLILLALISTSC